MAPIGIFVASMAFIYACETKNDEAVTGVLSSVCVVGAVLLVQFLFF